MKKRIMLSIFLIMCCLGIRLHANIPSDGDNLYVLTKTSTQPMVFSLDNLDKITFTEDGVNLWNTSWPTRYSYDNFRVMAFKEPTPDAIQLKEMETSEINVTFDRQGDCVRVNSARPIKAVIVYDLHGYLVANDRQSSSKCEISLSHTPRGIYVVQVFSESNTIIKQKIVK